MTFVKADKGTTNNKNDKCMTPPDVAKRLINLLPIRWDDFLLDAFRGTGAFYNNFPPTLKDVVFGLGKDWCEIDDRRDFFDYAKPVDWIISNPPYSIFDAVLDHSFEIANNVAYLVPLSKIFSSMGRIRKWQAYGNIKAIWILSASKCGFPFGFPAAFVWWEKGYKGETKITTLDKGGDNDMKCPFCNTPLVHENMSDYWCVHCNTQEQKGLYGSDKLWQELIRTRKALDVIKKEMSKETMPDFAVIHNTLKGVSDE